jgi:tetratricopeptide (TPR) repeat protein
MATRVLICAVLMLATSLIPGGISVGEARADIPGPSMRNAEDEVPYGVASSWLLGRQLLVDGNTEDALPYLHFAYRAQPNVQAIAMTFQEALANGGYLRDALEVMDTLVAAWPDSQAYLLRRSSLNLQAGQRDKALNDLELIRQTGMASPEVLSAEATLLAAAGKPESALEVFREGLQLFPAERGRFYLGMASILQQEGKLDQIPTLMEEALSVDSSDAALWLLRIRSLAALQRHDEAVATVREATSLFAGSSAAEPDSATIAETLSRGGVVPDSHEFFYVELADYYAQHGELTRAVDLLHPLSVSGELGLSPSLWLGRLYLGTGRDEEGAALVDEVLAQWPESGRAWFLRGKVDENAGNWMAAVPYYRRAADFAAHDPEIRLGLVRALLVAGERQNPVPGMTAVADSNRAELLRHAMVGSMIAPDADSEGQLILGYAFLSLEDFERGAYRFELAADNPEFRITALTQMSICQDRLGQIEQARAALDILRAENPDNAEVANSLGYFLAEKGLELDLAESLVKEALEVQPGNGAFLDSLGWVYYRQGRLEDALDQLIRAVNALPEDPVILEHVGVTLMKLGQHREASELIQRALNLGGERDRLEGFMAEIKQKLGE